MSSNRKDDHLRLALGQKIKPNDFDKIRLQHHNLKGINIKDVNLKASFLGKEVPYPFYINAMTGGTKTAFEINMKLSKLANHFNIPMMVGSQMITFRDSEARESFEVVKTNASKIIKVANINANATPEQAKSAIEMIDAEGLAVHLNILQELQMSEGDRDFSQWILNIKRISKNIEVPIIVKEVGFGLSIEDIQTLNDLDIKYVDISGRGGTDFGLIEANRSDSINLFDGFGKSTVDILIELKQVKDKPTIYASGGIRNSLDVIKGLVLGAEMIGISKWFLDLTTLKFEDAVNKIDEFILELKMYMTALGTNELKQLNKVKYSVVL